MATIAQLQQARQQIEQDPDWSRYWQAAQLMIAAESAFVERPESVNVLFDPELLEPHMIQAEVRVKQLQHDVLCHMVDSDSDWTIPRTFVSESGHELNIEILFAARTLYEENKRTGTSPRVAIAGYGIGWSSKDKGGLTQANRYAEQIRNQMQEAAQCAGEFHVPKSQRHDFAQTRGPRPQNDHYFSRRGSRAHRPQVQRQRGRGR